MGHDEGGRGSVSAVTAAAPALLPLTSLIICTRNRPALLADTLASILQGDELPNEIVVVDQSRETVPPPETLSGSDTFAKGRPCEIRLVRMTVAGTSFARNAGTAAARHDVLAFCDDDMLATPGWFGSLVRALMDAGEESVTTGRVLPASSEARGRFTAASVIGDQSAVYAGRIGRDVLASGNMALYRSAFEEIGPFDERLGPGTPFPAAEDNDFGFRALEAGYRIVYVPEALAYHRAWRSRWTYPAVRWRYGRGKGGFYAKHLRRRDRYMVGRMAWDVGHRLRRFPRTVLRHPSAAAGDIAYIIGIGVGLARWFTVERRGR